MIEAFFPAGQYAPMAKDREPRIPREMYPDKIGQRMRMIREAFGMSPAEISDMLDIERTYWTRWEKGHRPPSDEVAFLLTERFGVTLDFLLLGKWEKLPLDLAQKLRAVSANN